MDFVALLLFLYIGCLLFVVHELFCQENLLWLWLFRLCFCTFPTAMSLVIFLNRFPLSVIIGLDGLQMGLSYILFLLNFWH